MGRMEEKERERERDREKEEGVKQMCPNCIPTMNMNTLCSRITGKGDIDPIRIQDSPPIMVYDKI